VRTRNALDRGVLFLSDFFGFFRISFGFFWIFSDFFRIFWIFSDFSDFFGFFWTGPPRGSDPRSATAVSKILRDIRDLNASRARRLGTGARGGERLRGHHTKYTGEEARGDEAPKRARARTARRDSASAAAKALAATSAGRRTPKTA